MQYVSDSKPAPINCFVLSYWTLEVADEAEKYSRLLPMMNNLLIKMADSNNFYRHAYLITSGATPL